MNSILIFLKKHKKDFKITDIIKDKDTEKISHIYFQNKLMYFLVVEPHSGNGYNYLFRANCKATFDRWSVCDIEVFCKDYFEILGILNGRMEELYEQALEILMEDYNSLYTQLEEAEDKIYNLKYQEE